MLHSCLQLVGSVFGMLLVAGLVPAAYIGMGNKGVGCFGPTSSDISTGMLFGWVPPLPAQCRCSVPRRQPLALRSMAGSPS